MIGNHLEPFKFWCQKVLPNVYDDSLSYYEYLCKLNEYLNEVIGQINTLTDNMEDYESDLSAQWLEYKTDLTNQWTETKNYIDHYFDNLDVQTEINNKLDAMASDGSLSALITPELPDIVATWLSTHLTPTEPTIDNTLTVRGAGADSKTVGDTIKSNIAPLYDSTKTYKIGDYVTYANLLYTCISDITVAEEWAIHHWKKVSLSERMLGQDITGEVNLFALKDSEFGFIDISGDVTNSYGNNNTTSDFIPVEVGEVYTGSVWFESSATGLLGIGFASYDSSKNFISDSRLTKTSINRTLNNVSEIWTNYTVPSGASYIRFCATLCNSGYAQLERGETRSMWKDSPIDRKNYTNTAIDYVLHNEMGSGDYLLQTEWEQGSLTNGVPTASVTSIRMKNKVEVTSPIMVAKYIGSVTNIVVSFYNSSEVFLKELVINTTNLFVVPENTKYLRIRIPYTDSIYNPIYFNFKLMPVIGDKPSIGEDFFKNLVWKQGIYSNSTNTIYEVTDKITSEPFVFNGSGLYRFVYDSIFVDNGHSIWTRVYCFKKDGTRVVYERQSANQTSPWEFYIPNDGVAGFFEVQRAGGGDISPSDMANAKISAFRAPEPNKFRYRLLTHNIGHFNYGGSGTGTENYGIPEPYEANLKLWKDQLAEVKPDIFGIQEFTSILSKTDQTKNITELINPIFNYFYNDETEYGIVSNITPHQISSLVIGSADRTIRTAKYYIGHGKFLNFANVHLRYDSAEIRASEMQSLIDAYANEEYVIIAGDFNEASTSEADIFVSAGYTKCNGGYFGEFATYDNSGTFTYPLDQIVFKGNIKLLNMERKSYVTSDHYALVCDFEIY